MRPNVVVVFAVIIVAVIGFVGGRALGDTERLEARVQALETRLGQAEGTISALDFYVLKQRHEVRIGLLEVGTAVNTVDIRWLATAAQSKENSAYAKFREAEALLTRGQRAEAQVMAYGAVIDLAGSRDRYCSPGAILVWDNNYGFPQSIREAFFRGGGPYVITEEGLDGRVALEASETTRSCRE